MEFLVPIVAIIAVFGTAVVKMILNHRSKMLAAQTAAPRTNGAPAAELEELAERLEQRVHALETILDAEVPDWRKRNGHS